MLIRLRSMEQIRNFVNTISKFEDDIDLCSGRYQVDAKSILGIFSLDLNRPIQVLIYDKDRIPTIAESIEDYIVA